MNDAVILEQVEGQYEKLLMMVLHKYLPDGAVLTLKDIMAVAIEQSSGDPLVLFTHGHRDSIEFKAIRMSAADRIAKHDETTNKGRG